MSRIQDDRMLQKYEGQHFSESTSQHTKLIYKAFYVLITSVSLDTLGALVFALQYETWQLQLRLGVMIGFDVCLMTALWNLHKGSIELSRILAIGSVWITGYIHACLFVGFGYAALFLIITTTVAFSLFVYPHDRAMRTIQFSGLVGTLGLFTDFFLPNLGRLHYPAATLISTILGGILFIALVRVIITNLNSLDVLKDQYEKRTEALMRTEALNLQLSKEVTERKRIEEDLKEAKIAAEASNKAKSDFLATMSHEIRTPMNGIIGIASLLELTELDEEQEDYVQTIQSSGDTLLTIINDILDFSKLESSKFELSIERFDIRACIHQVLDILALKAKEKALDLNFFCHPSVPQYITGDPSRLRQILLNLINNALKFTDEGEVIVEAHYLSNMDIHDSSFLEIRIQDTGIGIREDQMHQLFQSFGQLDSSFTRKHEGTGLGLAISQGLAHLMGGSIHAQSKGIPGKGSTFTLSLPISDEEFTTSSHEPIEENAS